jgi:hypothetical protein
MTRSAPRDLPPYPRLGEIYRPLALAIDSKAGHRLVDRLAREGEFDWSLVPTLCDELVVAPLRKYTDSEFADLLGQFLTHLHSSYVGLVSTVPLDSLSRAEALPLMVESYFAWHGAGLIYGSRKSLADLTSWNSSTLTAGQFLLS